MGKYNLAIKYDKKTKSWGGYSRGRLVKSIPRGVAVPTNNGYFQYNSDGTKTRVVPQEDDMVEYLWEIENPKHKGRGSDGLYRPFNTGFLDKETGEYLYDIGPGICINRQPKAFRDRANRGMTRQEIESYVREKYVRPGFNYVNRKLLKYTNRPDTVSPNIKMGLADIYYQAGDSYDKVYRHAANGNYSGIKEESVVKAGGRPDERRNNARWTRFLNYKPIHPKFRKKR